jgi:hypothetical protein
VTKRHDNSKPEPAVPSGGAPAPLVPALATLSEMLSNAIEGEATYPSRPELHRRLKAIEDAARLLTRESLDLKILALLLDGDERIENQNETYHGLKDIAARAARANARPRKQGRGKLYPKAPTWPSPMELCALMIETIWQQHTGQRPPVNNAKVHQLCEALWRKAAGGGRRTAWGDSASGWRNHLRAAKLYRAPHQAGRRIEHVLAPEIRPRPVRVASGFRKSLYDHPRWLAELVEIEKEGDGRKKTD